MQEDRNEITSKEENKEEQKGNTERFESDTQKVVRRHLENEDDIITDEDIKNVRVGMTPPIEERITPENVDEKRDKALENNFENSDEEKPSENPVTPWDTIEPPI